MTKRAKVGIGSQTNASDAVDDVEVRPDPTADEVLDAGVAGTFPASDPVAAAQPNTGQQRTEPVTLKARSRHAADWMFKR